MKEKYKLLISTGIAIFSVFLVALLLSFGEGMARYAFLSDVFTIPAAVYISAYILSRVAASGVFDIFAYSARKFFGIFIPRLALDTDYITYREGRAAERGVSSGMYLLIPGLILLLPAVFFSILFYV